MHFSWEIDYTGSRNTLGKQSANASVAMEKNKPEI